jgi:hypothetical protein
LIFEPQHKNIATLMAFLITIFLGIGAGWLAGSFLSGASPVKQGNGMTEPVHAATRDPVGEAKKDTDEVKAPAPVAEDKAAPSPVVEEQGEKEPAKTRAHHRGRSRRAYVAAHAGEPIPLAVIKGKPLKKAFRHLKRVKVW